MFLYTLFIWDEQVHLSQPLLLTGGHVQTIFNILGYDVALVNLTTLNPFFFVGDCILLISETKNVASCVPLFTYWSSDKCSFCVDESVKPFLLLRKTVSDKSKWKKQ